mmetsp:Transcript_177120/g.568030  ORF Transcript_177120/g.568030 Transcript_177120/m.568030 type:complete len:252 (+) Transcript_177120:3013-3768(+)
MEAVVVHAGATSKRETCIAILRPPRALLARLAAERRRARGRRAEGAGPEGGGVPHPLAPAQREPQPLRRRDASAPALPQRALRRGAAVGAVAVACAMARRRVDAQGLPQRHIHTAQTFRHAWRQLREMRRQRVPGPIQPPRRDAQGRQRRRRRRRRRLRAGGRPGQRAEAAEQRKRHGSGGGRGRGCDGAARNVRLRRRVLGRARAEPTVQRGVVPNRAAVEHLRRLEQVCTALVTVEDRLHRRGHGPQSA